MSRRVNVLDRAACLLVGLALVALGALVADWRYELSGSYPRELDTRSVDDVLTASWWPWTFAVVAVLVGVLAVLWLLAHLRPGGPRTLRLGGSGPTGRLELDLRSLASSTAEHLAVLAPVSHVSGSARTVRSVTVIELRGHLVAEADVATVAEAAGTLATDLHTAFPDDDLAVRVVLDAPRRSRAGRTDSVRVR